MAMNDTTTINAPLDRVIQAYTSEDFARRVSERAGVELTGFTVDGDVSGPFTVTTVRAVGADKVPGVAKKFLGNGMTLTQKDLFKAPGQDGSRDVETTIDVAGVPISANASQTLVAQEEKTVATVSGEVKANIPLVGKKISQAAEPYIGKALSLQASTAEAWIRENQ